MDAAVARLPDPPVSEDQFRELMSVVCGPVTVVTTMAGGAPAGTTVSALMSLSLRPPLVTLALDRSSRLLGKIRASGRFGVNILGYGQEEVALVFATKGDDKFAGVAWAERHGLPLLDGVAGWAGCTLDQEYPGGDHVIVVGAVTDIRSWDLAPLVYGSRKFGTHVVTGATRDRIAPAWPDGWDADATAGCLAV
jgi:flavin reductase (DIM6/NTAB) family NADH-FMN oxidoreductase RutF